ncbi:BREX system P-loop protein BrxC [Desulfobulbus alkaliphilus]|uniref:BREX system P-loop protein BrxC n=1 Tax=Desulfobulbus alkaliphilus TaxID=869814 RepID=UPI0019628B9E|nr:BREX system P-loop protein BrxC [Desulfobulbus alkaliphilus]MBM9538585.1 BREX system P-loop protein BrxC [Desulfobulbus alkaliphilus]
MTKILDLFDSTRALNRPIEKVITYQNRTDDQIRAEISEYVVTEHIEESFADLLEKMQMAQQGGGGHEIGVWVSGFYGSGKSSFTKYLGFALDRSMLVGGDRFLKLLQNQLRTASTRALFNQVSTTYDAAVIFLDLASEMLAGASMEDISTVLYLKVLQWAGYSEDLKVAELERMLEMEDRLDTFLARAKEELDGIDWADARNQPLVANQIAARLANEFYPRLFPTPEEFQNLTLHVNKSEVKRAEEMVELIRRKSGKKNILFIIDEVGQYVSAKPNLILNLDGLAKNLRQIGNGTVWLFATAQQTLTEDNPTAMLNAPGLFKLKDRFPIQVHLEASDIKEICHRRLLTKSAAGEKDLAALFDGNGASLRTATQLQDGGVYEAPLDRKTFIALYPFLPAHFEILLQLLGRLARKTGGLGLRSAIKVLQEVLVERIDHQDRLADTPLGTLANTVTFYNSLRRDIQSSYSYIVEGVMSVTVRFPNQPLYLDIAKSIAVLQILENLPVTTRNIAALLHPSVGSPSSRDEVEEAVAVLLKDGMVPLGEKNGSLRFLTQAAITLQKQFDLIEYRQADLRAETNGVLRGIFKPLPSARLSGVRPVTAGLKVAANGQTASLEGDKEAIQIHVEFVQPERYETVRTERENDSRSSHDRSTIFLLARSDAEIDQLAVTMVRCHKFLEQHRTAVDPETQEFVRIIDERFNRTAIDAERKLMAALAAGSFVAHGTCQPVAVSGPDMQQAARNFLGEAAGRVFDRYGEAAHQADSNLAEKFLKTPMDRVTTTEDPLAVISRIGGRAQIKSDHKALVSIKDYLGQQGQVEGRRLLERFADPPFGWSKDTTRYLLAAAFLGGEIKLRLAGQDHVVKNDETLAAFASNRAFGAVGVSLRMERPPPETLMRAADRLCDLTGENVLPLEDEVATIAKKYFPGYQSTFGPLAVDLRGLGLEEATLIEKAENLANDLTEVVSGDGSDAVNRLGGLESPLHDALIWARTLKKTLDNGLREQLRHLYRLRTEIETLPDFGLPAQLKQEAAEQLSVVRDILDRESFFEETAALGTAAAELDRLVSATNAELARQQTNLAQEELNRWQTSADWLVLSEDEHTWFLEELDKLAILVDSDLDGLKQLLRHDYSLNHRLRDLTAQLGLKAAAYRESTRTLEDEPDPKPSHISSTPPPSKPWTIATETIVVPKVFISAKEIDLVVEKLNKLRHRISPSEHLRITWKEMGTE